MPNRKKRSILSSGKSASTDVRPKRTRSATERVEQEAPDVVQLQQSGDSGNALQGLSHTPTQPLSTTRPQVVDFERIFQESGIQNFPNVTPYQAPPIARPNQPDTSSVGQASHSSLDMHVASDNSGSFNFDIEPHAWVVKTCPVMFPSRSPRKFGLTNILILTFS